MNNYTITFDYGNGTVVNETLIFNGTIVYPKNLTREGYTIIGWKPKPERMPENDTVVAQWKEVKESQVEIVFSRKGMTEEEAKAIIKKWTDRNFEIIKFEEDKDTGETTVIIEFKDVDAAIHFVDAIKDSSGSLFISVNFLSEPPISVAVKAEVGFFVSLLAFVFF